MPRKWSVSTAREIIIQIHEERERHRAVHYCIVLHVKKSIEFHFITPNLFDARIEYSFVVTLLTDEMRISIIQNLG